MKVLCLGTTPAVQRVMMFNKLTLDQVNRAATTLEGAAGKSVNVAKVLKTLGSQPVAVGFLGGERGAFVQQCLTTQGVEQEFVHVRSSTRQCVTLIDQSTHQITELVEESQPVQPEEVDALFQVLHVRMPNCRAVVMSGTLAPGVPTDLYLRCTRMAHETGALSVIDAQGPALRQALEAKPSLVKPNRAELAATVGHSLTNEESVKAAMLELTKAGAHRVVVTDGKNPALAWDGRQFWRITMPSIRAVNPIGSGDAFTAGLVWRLIAGEDLGEACRWAAAGGAANALTIKAGELELTQVKRLVNEVKVERLP